VRSVADRMHKRWMIRGLAAAMAIGLLIVAAVYARNVVERRQTRQERYAVWSAFLNREFLDGPHDYGSSNCRLIIRNRTVWSSGEEQPVRDAIRAWLSLLGPSHSPVVAVGLDTARGYLRRNVWRESVTRDFDLRAPYELVASSETPPSIGWDAFDRRFPDHCGWVTLSVVGFDSDRTEALFRENHYCPLCGGGGFVLMRKKGGKWYVAEHVRSWVS
jgi:hypothetical protein